MNANAFAGNSLVTLMLRRTDVNNQANLTFASKYYPGSNGICAPTGTCTPTFGPPGYFGSAQNQYQGPIGTYWATNASSIITATPSSTLVNGQVVATLGGTLTTDGGATQYVEYSLTGQNQWTPINAGGSLGGAFTQTVTGLSGDTTYDVQAYAVYNTTTVYGGVLQLTTPISAPAAPTAGDTTATISFTAGATGGSDITNYQYSLNGGTTWIALSPAQTGSPVTISGLTDGTSY